MNDDLAWQKAFLYGSGDYQSNSGSQSVTGVIGVGDHNSVGGNATVVGEQNFTNLDQGHGYGSWGHPGDVQSNYGTQSVTGLIGVGDHNSIGGNATVAGEQNFTNADSHGYGSWGHSGDLQSNYGTQAVTGLIGVGDHNSVGGNATVMGEQNFTNADSHGYGSWGHSGDLQSNAGTQSVTGLIGVGDHNSIGGNATVMGEQNFTNMDQGHGYGSWGHPGDMQSNYGSQSVTGLIGVGDHNSIGGNATVIGEQNFTNLDQGHGFGSFGHPGDVQSNFGSQSVTGLIGVGDHNSIGGDATVAGVQNFTNVDQGHGMMPLVPEVHHG